MSGREASGCPRSSAPLRQKSLDDVAVDVGQAEVAALEAVRQPLVVQAQAVEQRRVEVVDVNGVADDVVAVVVGVAVGDPRLDAAADEVQLMLPETGVRTADAPRAGRAAFGGA